ncbi:hypothetical protein [Frigoriglobus tundricola]|uniref:Uncharacterized protein n=1 Tax=Frigoriglobus tundricola TaxID=2774151 RepID=A0A6M5YFN3_9BACT|nr:hypothetical protein [Frigoriglobus tundricola]QJW92829.1 hypothetical protein FTUN_0326 [Frigoriglobus tundricola]
MSRFTLLSGVACVMALAAPVAAAPPIAGRAYPDSLPLGTLHIDAIAEAAVRVFAPTDDPDAKVKVEAPAFVKVLKTDADAKPGYLIIEIAIDTARAGDFKGEIAVSRDKSVAKVPVSATVTARKPGTPRVLVVGTPFGAYSADAGTQYKGWTDVVTAAGLDVSYVLVRNDQRNLLRDINLARFNSVLVADGALVLQTRDDVKRLRAYAENGGRVVVATAAFYTGSVKGANAVLDGYGLEMLDQEPPPAAKTITLARDDFTAELVKAGVGTAAFFRASPIEVRTGGRVLVNAAGYGKPGLALVATAKAGKGEVHALGVSVWWYWVSEGEGKGQAKGSDNAKLLGWLLVPPRQG